MIDLEPFDKLAMDLKTLREADISIEDKINNLITGIEVINKLLRSYAQLFNSNSELVEEMGKVVMKNNDMINKLSSDSEQIIEQISTLAKMQTEVVKSLTTHITSHHKS